MNLTSIVNRWKSINMTVLEIITICLVIVAVVLLFIHLYLPDPDEAKMKAAGPKLELVNSAVYTYILETDRLPSKLEDLLVCPVGLEDYWNGPYLKEKQLYDPWGNKYIFDYGYRLQSLGADGKKGGKDKNEDMEVFKGLVNNEN